MDLLLQPKLTVDHLEDAAIACQTRGQLVASCDHVAGVSALRHALVRFIRNARRVGVVATGVFGVDGTGTAVVRCAVEWVHVETVLSDCAVGPTVEIVGIAEEDLQMALEKN